MTTIKGIWDCMFSPRLIKVYDNGPIQKVYEPQTLERWGDQLYIIWKIGVYTSPILVGILYQRGYLTVEGLGPLTKFVTSIGVILIVSYCCRGVGRYQNPTYKKFMETLEAAQKQMTPEKKLQLSFSEFEFKHWPVEFSIHDVIRDVSRKKITIDRPLLHTNFISSIVCIPFRIIAYLAIHTFGIRLIYPGSLGFLQLILEQNLLQGRFRLIETNKGERFKLRTMENNEIDSMFIDKRNKTQNGNTLVVCCEGNAGFYEIGIMVTPIEAGYSVLGWNHPGFGGSTGKPFPEQEQNAIDTVMQFAINKLGFKLENILLFGWSIGGYASSWAAMNYPDIKGIVLDATFDDILPLALAHMPVWWGSIVRLAIREHVNLNIYQQLANYPGPVLLIRRTEDEVICLKENDLSSNRGNNLLIKLLCCRYPIIFGEAQVELLKEFLAISSPHQEQFLQQYNINESMCHSLLQSYITEYLKSYPMTIGEGFSNLEKNQMVLFLTKKYLKDFKSTHCINLPGEMFQLPWDFNDELLDFVFT